jgi:hypothetical protein
VLKYNVQSLFHFGGGLAKAHIPALPAGVGFDNHFPGVIVKKIKGFCPGTPFVCPSGPL